MKKVLYEHLVSCSNDSFVVPIKGRYSDKVVRDAGFEVETTGDETVSKKNVIGTPRNLVYEYLFSGRDGAERARDTQSAQVLGTLVMQMLQVPDMAKAMGKERVFGMFNEIFRMSGAHDLKLETDEQDMQEDMANVGNEQFIQQIRQQWPQVMEMLQTLAQVVQGQGQGQPSLPQQQQPPPGAPPMQGDQKPKTSPDQQVQL